MDGRRLQIPLCVPWPAVSISSGTHTPTLQRFPRLLRIRAPRINPSENVQQA